MNLADTRKNYLRGQLRRQDLDPDPLAQFRRWMDDAVAAGVIEPTAMSLATVGSDGLPRVRTVLLKGASEQGFVFYTNFGSRKGRQLAENPVASLLLPWLALERQVIVTGRAEKVSEHEAREYFQSRPRGSQFAAWASNQSDVLTSRAVLDAALEQVRQRFGEDESVPLPPFWGGYRVRPDLIEFWQGRADRTHDRFEYTREADGGWRIDRLSP